MGLLGRIRRAVGLARAQQQLPPPPSRVEFSWSPGAQPWLPGGTYVGTQSLLHRKVSRDDALTAPSVVRARNLLCSISALPLLHLDADRQRQTDQFLRQIDPYTPNVVTLAQTVEDLIFEGTSWWQITQRYAPGRPAYARHVDHDAVLLTPPPGYPIHTLPSGLTPDSTAWVMGEPVPRANLIRFDSPNPPALLVGARAIRRAIKLAQTAEMYADDPEARGYWTSRDGVDPDEDEVRRYLERFVAARRGGAEAWMPGALIREGTDIMSPADMRLPDLIQASDREIANLFGLEPEVVAVSTTSRTYQNAVDRRIDKINETLGLYMAAIADRLSLDDITPRGHRVIFDVSAYLRADPATRWQTYETAVERGIMTVQEVREREGLPAVPVETATRTAPSRMSATLSGDQGDSLTFDTGPDTAFAVDSGRRTVTGTLLPYGAVARNRQGKWRFAAGSVQWERSSPARTKLNRDHDHSQLLGRATVLRDGPDGINATFKIAHSAGGDLALNLAADEVLDGLSAEVDILEYEQDPADATVSLVTRARLTGAALTATPAFDDARLTSVSASTTAGGQMVTQQGAHTEGDQQGAPAEDSIEARFAAAVEAFTQAVEALTQARVPVEQQTRIPAPRVAEPMVYTLNGLGNSFVRDAWNVRHAGFGSAETAEAAARLSKYATQTGLIAEASAQQQYANAGNTTDQADIIPPGYRPDLYVGQLPQGRPLFDALTETRIVLQNATPFKVPYWVGSAGLSGTNTEGTGPSTGTITDHSYVTVTPTAQSGEFVVTRELMDSANPAIDRIALNAMREEYSQDTEGIIAAHIAAYTDDGSPTMGTSDTSTEGCYVYAVVGTGNDLYIEGIRHLEGEYPSHRFLTPNRMLAGPTGYGALLKAIDDVGRPMFPFTAPANAGGQAGRAGATLTVDGLYVPQAWSMTSTYDDVVVFNSVDILAGESPMLTFRFEEKGGPENIFLNLWAYFTVQILRPAGIHAINYTAA